MHLKSLTTLVLVLVLIISGLQAVISESFVSNDTININNNNSEIRLKETTENPFIVNRDSYDEFLDNEHLNYPKKSQSSLNISTIKGYITDNSTHEPIEGTRIIMLWSKPIQYYNHNIAFSDNLGFYSIDVTVNELFLLYHINGYFGSFKHVIDILENDTLWVNISLNPGASPETSTVKGYITDNVTGEPIKDGFIWSTWLYNDSEGYLEYEYNITIPDNTGFYMIKVPEGKIRIRVFGEGYFPIETGFYEIDNYETLSLNISLDPIPPENSVVKGYITDNVTGYPLENVRIIIDWRDYQGHYYINDTFTYSSGFYNINVAAGDICLHYYIDGYFSENIHALNISEFEILSIDISLDPIPPENSIIEGYIINRVTGDPIEDARISIDWRDYQGHHLPFLYNSTYTDSSGFYSINVAAGIIDLYIYADGYYSEYTSGYTIGEFETLSIDIYLDPRSPENSVVRGYVTNRITGDPIEDVHVDLWWTGDHERSSGNSTYTDSNGFYSMNVAAGEIDLFFEADGYFHQWTQYYTIGEFETFSIDVLLDPEPLKNSVVKGYVTSNRSGNPIEGSSVYISCKDDHGNRDSNHTRTDSSGFYRINISAGIIDLQISADGYYSEYIDKYTIGEYETLSLNISLDPKLPENSIVKGYITDNATGNLIEDASVFIIWRDDQDHSYHNSTYANSSGFYSINVASGQIDLHVSADGYYDMKWIYYTTTENETIWINISLREKLPMVEIIRPQRSLYINNVKVIPFLIPLIIGDIVIKVDTSRDIDYVEFYIDGDFKYRDDNWPYEWYYNLKTPFRNRHKIKTIGYEYYGEETDDEIVIWKFL